MKVVEGRKSQRRCGHIQQVVERMNPFQGIVVKMTGSMDRILGGRVETSTRSPKPSTSDDPMLRNRQGLSVYLRPLDIKHDC